MEHWKEKVLRLYFFWVYVITYVLLTCFSTFIEQYVLMCYLSIDESTSWPWII